jgi:hypothetical protein
MGDLAALEFDLTPHASGQIKWKYVMGSTEWGVFQANTTYSDAFFMGIKEKTSGGTPTNVAMVPGTNTPVAITTISPTVNSQYMTMNKKNTSLAPTNVPYNVGYSGFTTVLETVPYAIEAGKTYRISLKLADGSDKLLDSAVW